MEAVSFKKGKGMQEQMNLFKVEESYNLVNLKESCRESIKKQFPNPIPGEDYNDYLVFIAEETDILFAERLEEIARQIKERIYGEQRRVIQEVYGKNPDKT